MNEKTKDIKSSTEENFSVKPVRLYPSTVGTYANLQVGDIIKVMVVDHDREKKVVYCENKLGCFFIKDENFFYYDAEKTNKVINCYMYKHIVARVVSIKPKGFIELDNKHLLLETIDELSHKIGTIVPATIENIVGYGLFVDIGNGIRSLCYINNVSKSRYKDLKEVFQNGDEISVKIMDFNPYSKEFIVSRKDAYERQRFEKYDKIIVTVTDETINKDGYYVEVNPATTGIMDKYPETPELKNGDCCYVSVKKDTPYGLRVRLIYKILY